MRRCFTRFYTTQRPKISVFYSRQMSSGIDSSSSSSGSGSGSGSSVRAISVHLREHVESTVTLALGAWPADEALGPSLRAAAAAAVARSIETLTLEETPLTAAPRELNKRYGDTTFFITRYIKHNTGDISTWACTTPNEIRRIVELEKHRDVNNGKIFEDITTHHFDIKSKTWSDTVADASELATYAQAAAQMGEKHWVRIANEWMRGACYRFFCAGGARKALIKNMKKSTKTYDIGSIKLSDNLMEHKDTSLGAAFDSKIRVLDVGACYNPLVEEGGNGFALQAGVPRDSMDVLGVDLYPASPSVLQCDFLNVVITAYDSAAKTGPAEGMVEGAGEGYTRVVSLPAESFDAAVMCLVLSYLPESPQRVQMVMNARRLLINPSPADGSEPHRTGLLIIVEKVSVFGTNNDSRRIVNAWRDTIEQVGFEMVSAQCLASTSNHAYGMIFRKVDIPASTPASTSASTPASTPASAPASAPASGSASGSGASSGAGGLFTRRELTNIQKARTAQAGDAKAGGVVGGEAETEAETGAGVGAGGVAGEAKQDEEGARKRQKTAHSPVPTTTTTTTATTTTTTTTTTTGGGFSPPQNEPPVLPPLRVAVIGGGIGGVALALALQKIKHISFKLYEKDESFSCRKQGKHLFIYLYLYLLYILYILFC
jgi:hypothetical protein